MGKRILVIDDDLKSRKLVTDLLNISGYTIIEATDGKQGVDLAKAERPDLIITDIQMPIMDGIEATKLIKADIYTRNIPIICVSSYAMKGDSERALEVGCDTYITKPLDIHELMSVVKKYLQ
ncbi:response regulator [Chloroflexota bacterium]